ncbi:MAG: hypothetical protein Q8N18_25980 [Opitutaceae bacterium]|nr:hypothetical protein [Opitutaceae bacterium]
MPTLREEIAEKKKALVSQDPPRNAERDAEIDAFIKENPKLHEKINAYSKEYLVRQKILGIMETRKRDNARDQEIREWVEQNPEIKQRVEERVKNVPDENRQRAFLNVAKTELMKQGMRTPRPS